MAKNMSNSWLPDLQLIAAPMSAPMELTLDIPMSSETTMSPMIQLQQPVLKFKLASPANSPSITELHFQLSCQLFLLSLFKHQGNTLLQNFMVSQNFIQRYIHRQHGYVLRRWLPRKIRSFKQWRFNRKRRLASSWNESQNCCWWW